MRTYTIKSFCEASHINPELIRAVIRQCGGWDNFKERAEDVCNHGASGGFSGFIYYGETCEFFSRNRIAILELANSLAQDLGENVIDMIKNFNCLRDYESTTEEVYHTLYGSRGKQDTQVANALTWFALEEVCRSYCDLNIQ